MKGSAGIVGGGYETFSDPKGSPLGLCLADVGRLREPSGPGITGVSLGIRPQWNDFIARPLTTSVRSWKLN